MTVVYFLAVIFMFSASISFKKIHRSGDKFGFLHPWGWPIGAFVWEDLFVFSLFAFIASYITIVTGDIRIGYLFFCMFWVIRSAGETLFFFLEQFIPENGYSSPFKKHFAPLRKLFGDISDQKCFVLMQVFHQMILVISCVITITLLLNWHNIR